MSVGTLRSLKPVSLVFVFIFGFFLSSPLYAWSNFFRFINNFNAPMLMTITPSLANVSSTCGGSIANVEVGAHAASCEFQFDTAQAHWYSLYANQGTITLAKKNDPASYCVYNYSYEYKPIPYSYFKIHSEEISQQSCRGSMKPSEISVVNDEIEALPRTLSGNLALNVKNEVAAKSTESFSQADCGVNSGDNCIIASPDMNTNYVANGSSLSDALRLQTQIDRFEPLNFAQFIGSHNSAISQHYTSSTSPFNLSYADPDSFLSLTELLNSGVRQIELDIEWYKNAVTICHDHESTALQGILCDGNSPLSAAVSEIRAWVEKNPDQFIIVYLDVNLPLAGYISNLDNDLSKLEPYVFTPAMAKQYFGVTGNTLPAYQISKDTLLKQYKKNIIITNDDDTANTQNSQYVFVKVQNSNPTPLYEVSVDGLLNSKKSCDGAEKYNTVKALFGNDTDHYNVFRMNEYRTVFDYVEDSNGKDPSDVVDYYTTLDTSMIASCPINVFSTSMLGFTCNSTNCESHPTDPKLFNFLWSWDLGYPLKNGGSNVAYIHPQSGHFQNNALAANSVYSVLCYTASSLQSPTAPLSWYLQTVTVTTPTNAAAAATLACQNSGGLFAAPTTSYWMNDVMHVVNAHGVNPYEVLVNYQNLNGVWTPNVRGSVMQGLSLVEK